MKKKPAYTAQSCNDIFLQWLFSFIFDHNMFIVNSAHLLLRLTIK